MSPSCLLTTNNTHLQQAFEQCRVGTFNCSHASMTSSDTLAVLRNLHITNPRLFEELSRNTTSVEDMNTEEEEPEFSDVIEDSSDVPVDAVKAQFVSGSAEGFVTGDDGDLVRVAEVEDVDFGQHEPASVAESPSEGHSEVVVPAALGRGRRMKKSSVPFGGVAAWSIG